MAKKCVYFCDVCNKIVYNPHKALMREFYIERDPSWGVVREYKRRHKVKIHLCYDCYTALGKIAMDKEVKTNENLG